MNEPKSEGLAPLILVVDLETTGLNSEKNSILQIGAVWLSGRKGEFFLDCRVWPGATVEPEALRINGMSYERCTDTTLPSEQKALTAFLEWVGPGPVMLAGLNPTHDRAFLRAAYRRAYGAPLNVFPHRCLDLHSVVVAHELREMTAIPSQGLGTDMLYQMLEMPPEPRPHHALNGARWEAAAFELALGWGQTLPEAV